MPPTSEMRKLKSSKGQNNALVLLIGDFEVKERRKHNVFPNKIRRCNKFVNSSRGSPLPEQ